MSLGKVGQVCHALGGVPGLQIRGAEVVGDVIAQVSSSRLGAVKRIDGLGPIVIEDVGVSKDEPGQRSGVFLGVGSRVGFDSSIPRRRAIEN